MPAPVQMCSELLQPKTLIWDGTELPVKSARVNSTELSYIEAGRGENLVLVHGTLADLRTWRPQLTAFSKHYRTISYSRRYHFPNRSTPGQGPYSPHIHAADLAALLDRLKAAPAHLVAHSYGGFICLLLAQDHPELVLTLSLGEPPIMGFLRTLEGGEALWLEFEHRILKPVRQAFADGDPEEGVRMFIDRVVGKNGVFDALPPAGKQALLDNAAEFQLELETPDAELFPPFICAQAAGILTPVLLLRGEHSNPLRERLGEGLERCLPDVTTVFIPRASHTMFSANPEAANAAVLEFLARRSS